MNGQVAVSICHLSLALRHFIYWIDKIRKPSRHGAPSQSLIHMDAKLGEKEEGTKDVYLNLTSWRGANIDVSKTVLNDVESRTIDQEISST